MEIILILMFIFDIIFYSVMGLFGILGIYTIIRG